MMFAKFVCALERFRHILFPLTQRREGPAGHNAPVESRRLDSNVLVECKTFKLKCASLQLTPMVTE